MHSELKIDFELSKLKLERKVYEGKLKSTAQFELAGFRRELSRVRVMEIKFTINICSKSNGNYS